MTMIMNETERILRSKGLYTDIIGIIHDYLSPTQEEWKKKMDMKCIEGTNTRPRGRKKPYINKIFDRMTDNEDEINPLFDDMGRLKCARDIINRYASCEVEKWRYMYYVNMIKKRLKYETDLSSSPIVYDLGRRYFGAKWSYSIYWTDITRDFLPRLEHLLAWDKPLNPYRNKEMRKIMNDMYIGSKDQQLRHSVCCIDLLRMFKLDKPHQVVNKYREWGNGEWRNGSDFNDIINPIIEDNDLAFLRYKEDDKKLTLEYLDQDGKKRQRSFKKYKYNYDYNCNGDFYYYELYYVKINWIYTHGQYKVFIKQLFLPYAQIHKHDDGDMYELKERLHDNIEEKIDEGEGVYWKKWNYKSIMEVVKTY